MASPVRLVHRFARAIGHSNSRVMHTRRFKVPGSCTSSGSSASLFSLSDPPMQYCLKNKPLQYNHILSRITLSPGVKSLGVRTLSTSSVSRQDSASPDEEVSQKRKLPALMDFPHIVWPKFSLVIRNWVKASFLVTPYFDREFNVADFLAGAKQALVTVSKAISEGKFEELEGLVHPRTIEEIKRNIGNLTLQETLLIAIDEQDIYLSFPYELGIILNDEDEGKQERFVELTAVFHILKGLGQLREREDFQPSVNSIRDHKDKVIVANVRFIREFTKGVEDNWVINVLNFFRPSDELED